MLSTKPGSGGLAEKDAQDNKNLAVEAFDSIKKAKALVESKCPGVVSCADILAISARDFVHLVSNIVFLHCLLLRFQSTEIDRPQYNFWSGSGSTSQYLWIYILLDGFSVNILK